MHAAFWAVWTKNACEYVRRRAAIRESDAIASSSRSAGIRSASPLSCDIRWNGELSAPRKIGKPIMPSLPTVATSAPIPSDMRATTETIPLNGK